MDSFRDNEWGVFSDRPHSCDKMSIGSRFIDVIEDILSTRKRRHIVGGVLISASLFFGGLAITAMTTKEDEEGEK